MKTLIAYASNKGAVQEVAETIRERLAGDADLLDLDSSAAKSGETDLSAHDTVILGASIHAGKVQSRMTNFITAHKSELAARPLGLYLCSLQSDDTDSLIAGAFTPELAEAARATAWFGGRVHYQDYNPIIRFILKRITKSDEDIDTLRLQDVDAFLSRLQSE